MPAGDGLGRDFSWGVEPRRAATLVVLLIRVPTGNPWVGPPETAEPPGGERWIGLDGDRDFSCSESEVGGLGWWMIITTAWAWINPRSIGYWGRRGGLNLAFWPYIFATGKPLRYILTDGIAVCGCQHRGGCPEQWVPPYWPGCNDRGGNCDGR